MIIEQAPKYYLSSFVSYSKSYLLTTYSGIILRRVFSNVHHMHFEISRVLTTYDVHLLQFQAIMNTRSHIERKKRRILTVQDKK